MDWYKGNIPILDDSMGARDQLFHTNYSRGYVPRDYSVQPADTFRAIPSEIPVIPKSEWDARFDEQEELESSLEHLFLRNNGQPAFVNLEQNGHGFCHTADTEVLTDRGWVAWPDYNGSDLVGTVNTATHELEFQMPFQLHAYEYAGPMVYSTNRRIDFGVTPDHQMYVRKWDERKRKLSDKYSFVRAADIGWYTGLLHAPSGQRGIECVELEVPDDRRYDGDDFFALLGLVISDGYAGGTENTRNLVSFASFREHTHSHIAALATRLGFTEAPSRRGVWSKRAGALAAWIRANCYTAEGLGAYNKRVPDIIKCASVRQIKHFLAYFDDRNRAGTAFYSTSKKLIDDLQELHLRTGSRAHIGVVQPKSVEFAGNASGYIHGRMPCYTLTVGTIDRLCIDKKKHIETEHYKGMVYCAAVPNHTLITRRNDSVLISSNCWSYSTGHAIMMSRMKQNQPLVRLNPHGPASIIKGGRDEGGWAALSAKFAADVGYPSEAFWPGHSLSLRNDTPAMRENCALHKTYESFVDLTAEVYDQNLTETQHATCLFYNQPCPSDFMWWGHSVCAIRKVRIEPGSWGTLIINSWLNWGRFGLGVLRGNQGIPDGALSILTTGVSTA